MCLHYHIISPQAQPGNITSSLPLPHPSFTLSPFFVFRIEKKIDKGWLAKKLWHTTNDTSESMKQLMILAILACLALPMQAQNKPQPYRAMLYSALLPGGGQIYNHQYLKAGLVIGVQGYLIGSAIYHEGKRSDYRDLANGVSDNFLQQQYLARSRDYKEKLNNDIWWIGITAALSMIDAYVDAHLYDFDEEKSKLQLRFEDSQLQIRYRF